MQLPLSSETVIVLDFETTGMSPDHGDRPIEVGAVRIEGGMIVDRFQQLMNPGFTISRFIDFARPKEPVFMSLNVGDLIEEALLVVGPKARQQETVIRKSISSLLPEIKGDRRQLGEELLNLLVNGLEAVSGQGELRITANLD